MLVVLLKYVGKGKGDGGGRKANGMNGQVTCVLGKPAIDAQADHDGAGASDGYVSTAHPKNAVAG